MTAVADMSLEQQVALLPPEEQDAIIGDADPEALLWDWGWNGRQSQILPIHEGEDGWEFQTALALAGRGWGKLLDPLTVVPTPSGWTTMGALQVGDVVFDERGAPTTVLATFDEVPVRAYRLQFSDGTSLVAGGEHQWVTWTHQERKQYLRHHPRATDFPADWPIHRTVGHDRWGNPQPATGPQIRTTDEIVATLQQRTARGDLNHCIPLTRPLILPAASLLVDPYVLGFWLGDGSSGSGEVTIGDQDATEVLRYLSLGGAPQSGRPKRRPGALCATYPIGGMVAARDPRSGRMIANGSLHSLLRQLGVLGDKHVPAEYLRASIPQRRALLAGLMDSDGFASTSHVEFSATSEPLALAVVELARSLGERPVLAKGRATLYGVDCGPKFRVRWRPVNNPFRLQRKVAKLPSLGAQGIRSRHRMIVGADPVPVMPMRCITVDSPHSMYLAGEGMIPTHNTLCGAQWIRALDASWATLGRDQAHMRVALVGRTAADVRDVMLEGPSGILNIYPPSARDQLIWTPSRRRLELPNGGVCLTYSAEEPSQLRGPQFHIGWSDELAAYKQVRSIDDDATAWENLRIAVRLGTHPQILATTTPKRVPLLRQLLAESVEHPKKFLIRRGKTTDNKYLSEGYLDVLESLYGGTALGRQELEGEMLDDVAGAMTSEAIINRNRISALPDDIPWIKLLSIDPSVAERPQDECGMVVIYISKTWPVLRRHAFVVEDLSVRAAPAVWGEMAIRKATEHNAQIVVETNQGANLVFQMLRQSADALGMPMPPMKEVWATKAKAVRSEPVGGAYARGRIHHVGELFPELESQITSWVAGESGYSPDRQDALVQGCASGLFPEAITSGGMGTTVLRTVADQHIPLGRNDRRGSIVLPSSRTGFRGY